MNKFIRCIKSKLKRRNERPDKVGSCSQQEQEPSGLHITDLPPEALARIFDLCSYDDLARSVRLVCKRFCDVATSVLNQGISNLGPKIDRAMADSVSRLEEGRSLEELLVKTDSISFAISDVVHRIGQGLPTEQQTLTLQHYMALMSMKSEYRFLRAVTWRHINSPYSGSGHPACFYAGTLLDEFLRLLRVAHHSPNLLGLIMHDKTWGNPVFKLSAQCSKFINHFTERTEKFKLDYSISGAKLIDLCHRLARGFFTMAPHDQAVTVNGTESYISDYYRTPYTWFNCLPSSHAQPNQRSEEPRSIYLRMRQLIDGRNHFFLEKIHHEKELLIHKGPDFLTLKYIVPSLYNPFHQNYGYLFFFGSMRRSKGDFNFDKERSPTVQLFDYYNLDFFTSRNETDSSDGVVNVPESSNVDLNIDIELHSPLRLVPIRFYDNCLAYLWPSSVGVDGYRQIRFR